MKVNANKIHVILGLAILTQVGCNANQQQRGQYLNPNIAGMQAQDLTTTGDAFRRSEQPGWGNAANGLANLLGGNPGGGFGPNPGAGQQGTGNGGGTGTVDPKGDGTQGTGTGGKKESPSFIVSIDEEQKWLENARAVGCDTEGTDKDRDGIPDECEEKLSTAVDELIRMPGLDKDIFNGAIVSAKRYVKEPAGLLGNKKAGSSETSILLTKEEDKIYRDSPLAKHGSGVNGKLDRQVAKKFVALSRKNNSDLKGFKALFEIEQAAAKKKYGADFKPELPIIDDYRASVRGKNIGFTGINDKFGLVRADLREMIPFKLDADGSFVSSLSGIASNTDTMQENEEFIYIAEFHYVVPAGGLDLRVGHLTSDKTKAIAGAKSGMFYVTMGNHALVAASDLISNVNDDGKDLSKTKDSISSPPNCRTVHLMIAYFADSKELSDAEAKAIFAENVFYHDKAESSWKPLQQESMRLQAMDRTSTDKCDVQPDSILFKEVAGELSKSKLAPVASVVEKKTDEATAQK